jgi:ribonuclease P protein component
MLSQAARLRKARDFKEVFEKGKGVKQGRLFLKAAALNKKGVRFGVVVSKQVAAKAVHRNRIKRVLREAIQHCMPAVREGHDIVLVTLPGFTAANLKDVEQKVMSIMKKSSLLKP